MDENTRFLPVRRYLADDMGLGKTVQAIAFLQSVLPEIRSLSQPALVVCPSSLLYNWSSELGRFAPELRLLIADGSRKERTRALGVMKRTLFFTTYPLLRLDAELYAGFHFHTMFLDEAQMIKNDTTQTARAVHGLSAKRRFALTGTPVENHKGELWSIYRAVFPQLLGTRKEFDGLRREQVARLVRPFMLRRLKSDVLQELPDKIETIRSSELLPEQKKLYAAYLVQLQQETLKHIDKNELQQNRIRILAGITRLRQICSHPGLVRRGLRGPLRKVRAADGAGGRLPGGGAQAAHLLAVHQHAEAHPDPAG